MSASTREIEFFYVFFLSSFFFCLSYTAVFAAVYNNFLIESQESSIVAKPFGVIIGKIFWFTSFFAEIRGISFAGKNFKLRIEYEITCPGKIAILSWK